MTDLWFLRNRVRIHISGLETDGGLALLESTGPAGDHTPLHVHQVDDEGFYVLDGRLTLWAGDDQHVLRAGDSILAPRGVPHTLRVDEDARWLVTSTPAGFEAFVRAVGTPDPGPLPTPDELARTAAQHGIEILGPPGMLPSELDAKAA
jgi:quercetin dioxygenase-like cupin family protein